MAAASRALVLLVVACSVLAASAALSKHHGPHWQPTDDEMTRMQRYLVSDDAWLATVAQVADANGLIYIASYQPTKPYDWVETYKDLLRNLLASMTRVGINNYVVFTSSYAHHEEFLGRGIRSIHEASFSGMTQSFNTQLYMKFLYALNLLARGYDVVVSDLDVVFLRNPSPMFTRRFNFELLSDAINESSWRDWDMNTGFYYAKSHPETARFIVEMLAMFEADMANDSQAIWRLSDQYYFNKLARRAKPIYYDGKFGWNITFNVLNITEFASMMQYWYIRSPQRAGVTPYVVHSNWVPQRVKIHSLREVQLWHIPTPFYYTARKFLTYQGPLDASFEEELQMLRTALGLAFSMGRALILPYFNCRNNPLHAAVGLGDEKGRCVPSIYLEMEALLDTFDVRESSFLDNPAVPPEFWSSTGRVTLFRPVTDMEIRKDLAHLKDVKLLEVQNLQFGFSYADSFAQDAFEERLKRAIKCAPGNWIFEAAAKLGLAWPYTKDCARDPDPQVGKRP
eukprot:tig00020927_g15982.t1